MNLYTKKRVWVTNPGKNKRKSERINKLERLNEAKKVVLYIKSKEEATKQIYVRRMDR